MDKKEIILEMQSGERASGLLPSSVSGGNSVDQMVPPSRAASREIGAGAGQAVRWLAPRVTRGVAEAAAGIAAGVNTFTPLSGLAVSDTEGARATQEWAEARYGASAAAGGGGEGSLLPPTASSARVGRGASAAAGGASAAGRGSYASELGLSESERRRFAAIQAGLRPPYSAGVLSPSSWSAVGQYAWPGSQDGSGGGGGGSIVRGANPIAHIGRTWKPRVVIGQSIGSYHKSSDASRKKASVGIHERRILPVAQTHKGMQNQRKWTLGEWVKTPEARAILIHLASMIRKTLKGGRRIHDGCRKGGNRTRKALSKICKV